MDRSVLFCGFSMLSSENAFLNARSTLCCGFLCSSSFEHFRRNVEAENRSIEFKPTAAEPQTH